MSRPERPFRSMGNLRSTTRRQRKRHNFGIFNQPKQKLWTPFTCPFLFLYISFPFSVSLQREMTISQPRFWIFSLIALTPHLWIKFPSSPAMLSKVKKNWHNDENDWQTRTCKFERRFRYRGIVDLKLRITSFVTPMFCSRTFKDLIRTKIWKSASRPNKK